MAPAAEQLVAAPRDVDADERDDARQPHQEPDEARARGALGGVEAQRQQRDRSSGTVAMMIAASDEATCCSPAAMSGKGTAISKTA